MEAQLDVLAGAEAERFLSIGEVEGVASSVFAEFFALLQLDGDPAVLLKREVLVAALG